MKYEVRERSTPINQSESKKKYAKAAKQSIMNKILVTLSLSMILISCQKENKTFLTDYFSKIQECKLKELTEYPADSIGHPNLIFSHEDLIILSEPNLKQLMSSYNLATKSFSRLLSRGAGPGELPDIQQIGLYKNDSLFFVSGSFSRDIFIYTFKNDFLPTQEQAPENKVSLFFDNNQVVYSQHGKKRFALYDTQNKSKIEFGEDIAIENCPPEIASHILTGFCAGNSELKRIVWASIYGDVFEIYDYTNPENVKTITGVYGVLPIITSKDRPVFSAESKMGVVSIAATNKYIYLLYNENKLKDFSEKKEDLLLCNKILVYDWNGNPKKLLKTDKSIRSISYNKKHNTLFCVGYDENNDGKVFYITDL